MIIDDIGCRCIEVTGSLSTLLWRNMPVDEKLAKTLIKLPIKDADGKQIGIVDEIDLDKNLWKGRILTNDSVAFAAYKNYQVSMSVEQ